MMNKLKKEKKKRKKEKRRKAKELHFQRISGDNMNKMHDISK